VLPSHLTKETAMNTKTKTILSVATAATLLLAAPLAAFADGRDYGYRDGYRGWGPQPYASHPGNGWKHGHYKHGYAYGPARGQPYYYYPAPRVVVAPPPVYVPVPAPVIAVPAPYPYPQYPGNSVNIGFRLFF
jgi:hypothetical protein